jgi:GcrA cell cycle regulator
VNRTWLGWTDEATDMARTLWLDGVSASQIAKRLGRTRNAVIGKMGRMGLVTKGGAVRQAPAAPKVIAPKEPPRPKPRPALQARALPAIAIAKPEPRSPSFASVGAETPRILAELERGMCRFPLDDPGPGQMEHTLFCADGVAGEDARYCAHHAGVCFQPRKEKKKAPRGTVATSAGPKGDPFELFPAREAA